MGVLGVNSSVSKWPLAISGAKWRLDEVFGGERGRGSR